jgi:2-polyprenyl-3-methyl-5-hydroxy-6-metoxy-1,4-benzoquinol methylase
MNQKAKIPTINLDVNDSLIGKEFWEKYKFLDILSYELSTLYKALQPSNNKDNNSYIVKNGQYKYYNNPYVLNLIKFLKLNNIKSFLDLGCGAGILFRILHIFNYELKLKGYEIEDNLIEICNRLNHTKPAVKKDILKLTIDDIKDYQVLYFWEPLCDRKLAEKFVTNLAKILQPNQIIVYYQSGSIGDFLVENKKIESMGNFYNYKIFRLKQTKTIKK